MPHQRNVARTKKKNNKGKTKGKYILVRARPALLSLALAVLILLPPILPRGANQTILPTHISLRKVSTAGIALWSPNIARTDGDTGHLFSHILPMLFHMTRAWPMPGSGDEVESRLALAGVTKPAPIRVDLFPSLEVRTE